MKVSRLIAAALLAVLAAGATAAEKEEAAFRIVPIGTVEREAGKTYLVVHEKLAEGLLGLDGFSHVVVLYWFDRNDTEHQRRILQVHPKGDPKNPLRGVFATRSPVRPNLIGFSVCKIVAIEKNKVQVDQIDAFDHTPLVDLKPFIPPDNPTQDVRVRKD
jgi:tRNA-Thr(GGU) m(6)t(6)A37 methyltransferase TsaA